MPMVVGDTRDRDDNSRGIRVRHVRRKSAREPFPASLNVTNDVAQLGFDIPPIAADHIPIHHRRMSLAAEGRSPFDALPGSRARAVSFREKDRTGDATGVRPSFRSDLRSRQHK
jgi:hypothetical protein